jgi:hypothetical protein
MNREGTLVDNHQIALEITRLKMRSEVQEILLLQLRLLLPLTAKGVTVDESKKAAIAALEDITNGYEKDFYASGRYKTLDESEKALYADEFREIVETMKQKIEIIAGVYVSKEKGRD